MKTNHNTQTNEQIIKNALEKAKVPYQTAISRYDELSLLQIIEENPNPIVLRNEIFEQLYLEDLAEQCGGDETMAFKLAKYFYEEFPELLALKKNNADTMELIKSQVEQAEKENLTHPFTDFIRGEFRFSKYRKIKELAEQELKNVPAETLSISFHEFALQILSQHEEQVEKIFADCGFDYNTEYAYGDEKEVQLDGKLCLFIWDVYNQIKH